MSADSVEALLLAWLEARSLARGVPSPIADRGGFRVDTGSDKEICRWVFASDCDGLRALGREIAAPRQFLKLLAPSEALRAALDSRWELLPESHFMCAGDTVPGEPALPAGYHLRHGLADGVHEIRILAASGELAASGYAAETTAAFVYDRIVTQPGHMRLGLGSAVMHALGRLRANRLTPQLLVATDAGRRLYETLGWSVVAPYATAEITTAAR